MVWRPRLVTMLVVLPSGIFAWWLVGWLAWTLIR